MPLVLNSARAAAQAILSDVLRKRRPLDAATDDVLARAALSTRDAGFARVIANETLRRLGQLEALLRLFVAKSPPPHRAGPTLEILLAGACELLFLDVAAHAAVDGANRLAAADHKAVHFKPLINATLRRISREGKDVLAAQDEERLAVPDWLWQRWTNSFGEETTRAIARAHLETPPLDILGTDDWTALFPLVHEFPPPSCVVDTPEATSAALQGRKEESAIALFPREAGEVRPQAGEGAMRESFLLPGNILRLRHAGRIEELPGYGEGRWWVQDFAASLPARLLGPVKGKTVIDLCAAPGGKTAQLARAGANVIAVERETSRVAMLKDNLTRLKLDVRVVEADMRDFVAEERAPFVLLDAPCSATGTIRRHPDLPWIKAAADVSACAGSAGELLEAAAAMVAVGGILVFAVCSLEPEEGVDQVAHFLRRHAEFRRDPIAPSEVFGLKDLVSSEGDLRALPCYLAEQGGMDGFYAARLRRS